MSHVRPEDRLAIEGADPIRCYRNRDCLRPPTAPNTIMIPISVRSAQREFTGAATAFGGPLPPMTTTEAVLVLSFGVGSGIEGDATLAMLMIEPPLNPGATTYVAVRVVDAPALS